MKALFTTCFVVILIISCAKWVRPQISAPGPTLLTDQNSAEAAALDSVTLVRDPIPVVNRNNQRRPANPLTLFGTNGADAGEDVNNCQGQGFHGPEITA